MPASESVKALTQIAAQAAADKFGTNMVAIDLSDQLVLSEVFLIVTGQKCRHKGQSDYCDSNSNFSKLLAEAKC